VVEAGLLEAERLAAGARADLDHGQLTHTTSRPGMGRFCPSALTVRRSHAGAQSPAADSWLPNNPLRSARVVS
jgi:hypothetical protein